MSNGAVNVSVPISVSDQIGPVRSAADGMLNSSGWTVATSGSKAGGVLPAWAMYALAGLALVLILKRKRK